MAQNKFGWFVALLMVVTFFGMLGYERLYRGDSIGSTLALIAQPATDAAVRNPSNAYAGSSAASAAQGASTSAAAAVQSIAPAQGMPQAVAPDAPLEAPDPGLIANLVEMQNDSSPEVRQVARDQLAALRQGVQR